MHVMNGMMCFPYVCMFLPQTHNSFIHSFILEIYIAPLQETIPQRRFQPVTDKEEGFEGDVQYMYNLEGWTIRRDRIIIIGSYLNQHGHRSHWFDPHWLISPRAVQTHFLKHRFIRLF